MRGVLVGAIGLLVLHALVARANQAQLSGITKVATGVVTRFLDPSIPALADHSASSSSTSTSSKAPSATPRSAIPAPTAR